MSDYEHLKTPVIIPTLSSHLGNYKNTSEKDKNTLEKEMDKNALEKEKDKNNITDITKNVDSIVGSVISKFLERSRIGKEKYGTDLDRTDLSLYD